MSITAAPIYRTRLSRRTSSPDVAGRLPVVTAAALAGLIFTIDAFTQLRIAAAVMYVVVVLLSANFCGRKGILAWGLACVVLTLVSFLIAHGSDVTKGGVGRTIVSILAISTTALLAMRNRAAADALRRSEAYLTDAQRLSLTGSFAFNPKTGQHAWSDETYRIFEYDRAVKPSAALAQARIHPDDADGWTKFIRHAEEESEDAEIQTRLLFADGRVKHIRSLLHPVQRAGGDIEYIGALMDITAAKQAEDNLHEARAVLAHITRVMTLGELTASIAHEVNQPLAGIVTNGEACMRWLQKDVPNLEEARKAVEYVISDGRRAGEVIRRLRALSRKDSLKKVPLNLNEIINESIPLVQRELVIHRIFHGLELAPNLPLIMGDKIQLQQVLINLLVNAVQALSRTSRSPRILSIRSEPHEESGIRVTVSDNGAGIDPENLHRVFDAFFTTRDKGMGMGLSICRSIIEAHGGRIWCSNNDSGGAVFGFILKQEEGMG